MFAPVPNKEPLLAIFFLILIYFGGLSDVDCQKTSIQFILGPAEA